MDNGHIYLRRRHISLIEIKWWHISGSSLFKTRAYTQIAPIYYLNPCGRHQEGLPAFSWRHFLQIYLRYQSLQSVWKWHICKYCYIPQKATTYVIFAICVKYRNIYKYGNWTCIARRNMTLFSATSLNKIIWFNKWKCLLRMFFLWKLHSSDCEIILHCVNGRVIECLPGYFVLTRRWICCHVNFQSCNCPCCISFQMTHVLSAWPTK